MKFMKLGSKPDTFYTVEGVRSVSSEVCSDIIIQVRGNTYLLHKFPLLSKCMRLQKLCAESHHQTVELTEFPGGSEAFELCAKFCYGITITLSAYNVVGVRCAAEYLQMTEDVEKGNLISKIESFFNSCILLGWKDSIITLQTTKAFSTWSEDLGITSRCIEAIASKVLAHPSKTSLSKGAKSWWGEDMAELQIDLYWRAMIGIKSGGKVPSNLIGEALQIYACCWFPSKQSPCDVVDPETALQMNSNHKLLLESIVSLLPSEKGSVPCSFLLKLLKAANKLGASPSSKMELTRRAGIQLEEAAVKDLLIPSASRTHDTTNYDVDVVMSILEQFLSQGQTPPTSPPRTKGRFERRRRSRSAENIDLGFEESRRSSSASHGSKLKVAKLIDGYLQDISHDPNLPLSKFISIAESIPSFARLNHDYLYTAIDNYLKAHPNLGKSERKRLCRVLDCKKLSMEACMHAAQNEHLPLRLVVQVLFHEHARASTASNKVADLPPHIKALLASKHDPTASLSTTTTTTTTTTASVGLEDRWSVSGLNSSSKSKLSNLKTRLAEDEVDGSEGLVKASKLKAMCSIPTRPKRMFSKLMSLSRSAAEKH